MDSRRVSFPRCSWRRLGPPAVLLAALCVGSLPDASSAGLDGGRRPAVADDDRSQPPATVLAQAKGKKKKKKAAPRPAVTPNAPATPAADVKTETGDGQPQKLPVPDAAAQAKATEVIKDLYKAEYAKRRVPDILALAARLLEQARKTGDDPVARYVLLRESWTLSAQVGDAAAAFKAVEAAEQDYDVDGLDVRVQVLDAAARGAGSSQTLARAYADLAQATANDALAEDEYGAALKLLTAAEGVARAARSGASAARLQARAREVEAVRKAYADLAGARAALEKNADDPAANLAVGKFLCFLKGDWAAGLPLLTQSSDDKLKTLAQKDLDEPSDRDEQAFVGDGWWDLAEQEPPPARANLQKRAYRWYQAALPRLTGLSQAKVQQRVKKLVEDFPDLKSMKQPAARPEDPVGLIRTLQGPNQHYHSVAISRDGQFVLSGAMSGRVFLWNAETGRVIREFVGHSRKVPCVAFAPDGKHAASCAGGDDRSVRVWELETGKEVLRCVGHTDEVWSVAFSPSGRQVLSGSSDHTLRLWDLSGGRELQRFRGHREPVASVAFLGGGRVVASGSWDRSVRLWDVPTGKELAHLRGHTAAVWTIAASPDGKRLLSAGQDGTARLWDTVSGREIRRLPCPTPTVLQVAFAGRGKQALTVGTGPWEGNHWAAPPERTVALWDLDAGKIVHRFNGQSHAHYGLAVTPDGRRAVSCGSDPVIRLWGLPQ